MLLFLASFAISWFFLMTRGWFYQISIPSRNFAQQELPLKLIAFTYLFYFLICVHMLKRKIFVRIRTFEMHTVLAANKFWQPLVVVFFLGGGNKSDCCFDYERKNMLQKCTWKNIFISWIEILLCFCSIKIIFAKMVVLYLFL